MDLSPPRLAARLRRLRDVLDCAVLPVGAAGAAAAFVVPAPGADATRLKRRLTAAAVEAGTELIAVLVDDIPRRGDETVDEAALAAVPVLGAPHLLEYRRQCAAAGLDVDVDLEPVVRAPGRLHLAGLAAEAPAPAAHANASRDAQPSATAVPCNRIRPPALSSGPALTADPEGPRTLPEALLRTAAARPEAGLHLVLDAERTVFLSYPELLGRAQRILGGLTAAGLRAGDRALLQLPSLDQYFPALWGCLLGGILPVTVARPPHYATPGPVTDKLHHAWESLGRPAVLCGGAAVEGVRAMAGHYPMTDVQVLDAARLEQAEPVTGPHPADPSQTALLQLSSGSTGHSKAIQITHRGVLEYAAGARTHHGGAVHQHDTTVNWLPLDHVGGLVMFHLRDTVLGCTAVHTPTELVVADPLRWLDLLEQYRGAHSWSPNFGYRLVVEALRQHSGRRWDLSSVRSLVNAGEQCTLPVMADFLAATAPHGLDPEAMLLGWGMAETCTAITYKRLTAPGAVHHIRKSSLASALEWTGEELPAAERTTFLSMGPPAPGARLRICDDADRVLPEGRIGRLQVASGRVTPGYLGHPQDTSDPHAEAFRGAGWFDTGDLGFLKDGELVITGRRKEVIIINGSHYFCHELENAVGALDGVTVGSVAACGVAEPGSGSERLVVFFVPADSAADIGHGDANTPAGQPHGAPEPPAAASATPVSGAVANAVRRIRAELARDFALSAWRVVPVTAAAFPRTTSGKIQRTALRSRFLDGGFDGVLRALDVAEGNAHTVPDAVYQAVWEPVTEPVEPAEPLNPATALVVADELGLAACLTRPGGPFDRSVVARHGGAYACEGPGRYTLDFADLGHWDTLWAALRESGRTPAALLHLAGYAAPVPDGLPDARLKALFSAASTSLILAVRAHRERNDAPLRVVTASRGVHRVTGSEPAGSPGALTGAVAQCLALEWPGAEVRHVDLAGGAVDADADELCTALAAPAGRPAGSWPGPAGLGVEVAVRSGRVLRQRLVKTVPAAAGGDRRCRRCCGTARASW